MAYAIRVPRIPRRSPLLGFIILMHAVVIYYINDGLQVSFPKLPESFTMVDIAPQFTKVKRVKPVKPDEQASKIKALEPPLPEEMQIPVEAPIVSPDVVTDAVTPDTSATLDPRHPLGKPNYPPQAIREGQQGLVVVNACVQADGRLTDVRLARSSGYDLLDTAAVKHIARPSVRMRPGVQNGQPVAQCVNVPIRFDLRNR